MPWDLARPVPRAVCDPDGMARIEEWNPNSGHPQPHERSLTMRPLALLLALALPACVVTADNSGGPPPEGEPVTFEILDAPQDFWCQAAVDGAILVSDEVSLDALLDGCEVPLEGADRDTVRQDLLDALNGGEAGDVLVYAEGSAGGCIGQAWIEDVTLDGDTLRPWMLKEDSSYGQVDVACTADWGLSTHLVRVSGAEDATSAELHLGVFNPELPGGPTTL